MLTTPYSSQTAREAKTDAVHYSLLQHEYGGAACLRDSYTNKGTSFTERERDEIGLRGLLPPTFQSLDQQLARTKQQMKMTTTPFEKHIALSNLRQRNERLFYYYVLNNLRETLPLVYTPVVGEACQNFSRIFRRAEGLNISLLDKGRVKECVSNWPRPADMPRVAVVTDGSRILGLGDLGWNGLGICIGKLSLYVAGAGIDPESTVPIVIDTGTNNEELLDDPLYLGLRRKRATSSEVIALVDEVMEALNSKYPNLIVQFEDWSTDHAFLFLERYQHKYPMFNDDIQGTGAVILGGFINAARLGSSASGRALEDQRILFVGAGSAAIGVAKQLMSFFTLHGIPDDEARKRIWTTDSRGLVTKSRGDKLAAHKEFFARDDNGDFESSDLLEIVNHVKPTALVGLCTVPSTFDERVLRRMAELNKRPIVCPLSNPTANAECTFQEALDWTNGSVIFAAGSPFDDIEFQGKLRVADQGNNFYIFPGIGLAGALSKAKHLTDNVIREAAMALADSMTQPEKDEGRIYPILERTREVSAYIAARCIRVIDKEGFARGDIPFAKMDDDELLAWIKEHMWYPSYDN
ncbi:malate dehydrogenase (oxaloacetate-decarboxylating) (NADP(+)) [Malassezia vespertilionis]|uniref:malate dehydrogenase (oxaloacetate-decarboxylating) (NADP(+)) n=1 Tax=Malassezia vespertilionis TaxID=2020962 RepID=UPI0024B20ED1|nr:malate dehydrogenase (oxaloacetate-decarboxylating) (NADP(+)) [Malassezia vespertilionis]WFD06447.1 malate dehydrogenase (oxaloacetate-decarboxylating) (NADP(+)) [Malassezia vespertilionis]